ncbi:MAG: stage II sporulation protein M [Nanoarchaeota archaeon]|nr:stage II sporulation protein M [Nanoarchaeota archaeon]
MKKRKLRRKKGKEFDVKEQYKQVFAFLKESKIFIYAIIVIFFTFALIAFFVPVPESIIEQIRKIIEELLKQTQGMSFSELTGFIILNNVQTSFLGMIFGIVLGIFPLLLAMSNGYLLGFVSKLSVNTDGFLSLWRLLPHGIFELPAVFISLGLGMKIGSFLFQKKKLKSLKEYSLNSLKVFFFVVIPLLIIAGIIEGALMLIF